MVSVSMSWSSRQISVEYQLHFLSASFAPREQSLAVSYRPRHFVNCDISTDFDRLILWPQQNGKRSNRWHVYHGCNIRLLSLTTWSILPPYPSSVCASSANTGRFRYPLLGFSMETLPFGASCVFGVRS